MVDKCAMDSQIVWLMLYLTSSCASTGAWLFCEPESSLFCSNRVEQVPGSLREVHNTHPLVIIGLLGELDQW